MLKDMEIEISGFPIKIFLRSDEFMGGDMGRWYPEKRMIFLNENLDPLAQIETLYHELFHAISDLFKLNFTEEQVHTLSVANFGFLRQNKELKERIYALL